MDVYGEIDRGIRMPARKRSLIELTLGSLLHLKVASRHFDPGRAPVQDLEWERENSPGLAGEDRAIAVGIRAV